MTGIRRWIIAGLFIAAPALQAQEVVGHSSTRSDEAVTLEFDIAGGETLSLTLIHGRVLLNGVEVGRYEPGGALEESVREAVANSRAQETEDLLAELQGIETDQLTGAEESSYAVIAEVLTALEMVDAMLPELVTIEMEQGHAEEGCEDCAEIALAPSGVAVVTAPRVSVEARPAPSPMRYELVQEGTSFVGGVVGNAMSLLATFIGMAFLGLGMLFFAPRQLETVADTVWNSFGRSFLAGLFAQPLILPAFGMMVVGLALTVIGIVVIPFAVLAFVLGLFLSVVAGYVAVARTVGEIYLRRKMARGEAVQTWGTYRYIVYGLLGLMAIWLPAVLLGRVAVAGPIAVVSAATITWVLATAGFGATILTRGGVKGTFVRRLDLALTDEQFWTSDTVPSARQRGRVPRSGT
jgi:hypothetical protein